MGVEIDGCHICGGTHAVDGCRGSKYITRLRDAEAAVVAAAEAWEFAFRDPADPLGYTVDEKHDELLAAVRALREVRGT